MVQSTYYWYNRKENQGAFEMANMQNNKTTNKAFVYKGNVIGNYIV